MNLEETIRKQKPTRVRFEIALDSLADEDIIEWLDLQPNKSDAVRQLIRKELDTQ